MTGLLEVADYLDALSATAAHAGNKRQARTLAYTAKLLRARNDQENTEPVMFVCPNCSHIFPPPPEE